MEESQVTVVDVVYLGYEQVERAGVPRALVRTVGRTLMVAVYCAG